MGFFRKGGEETRLTYEELERDSGPVAARLLELGVGKGDRVVFYLDKCLFQVTAHLAVLRIGAVGVPLNPGYKESEMEYLLGDADPALVIAGPGQEETVRRAAPGRETLPVDPGRPYRELDLIPAAEPAPYAEVEPDDPGLIIYTSGTTGRPKGAVLTHGNLAHDALKVRRVWEITEKDVLCHVLPLFHVHGLCFALHTCLTAGACVNMVDRFSPGEVLDLLTRKGQEACTLFMAVPAMYTRLMEELGENRPDFSHVRLWTSGSAPLLPADFERIRRVFGKEPVEREGMTETGMNFSNPVRGRRKPGSIGLPLPGVQVRIVDPESLRDVGPGQTGEIWLKGSGITPGYWKKPRETAESFARGWFRTGDLGRVDEDGYYYLTDRTKHIIISAGENISPKEIESVINLMEGVAESSVVGVPDEKWGEKVVAAVVPEPGAGISPVGVRDLCKERLHDWKCPKGIRIVDQLPRNTMGKVLKEEVKKLFHDAGD